MECNYLQWSFQGTKSLTQCCFSRLCPYLLHRTLYKTILSQHPYMKLKVKVWFLCTRLVASFWRLHYYYCCTRIFEKKSTTPFQSLLLFGTRTLQVLNEGAFHRYRRLAEGLVYTNSLVSSFQAFLSNGPFL